MEKGYESNFRSMLKRTGARRLEKGVRLLLARARLARNADGLSEAESLTTVFRQLSLRLQLRPRAVGNHPFYCDAGLGGLARWLDDFFVCQRCGKLFWHGTHWSRIRNGLETASS